MKIKLLTLIFTACAVLSIVGYSQTASAADARNFNAGKIIDDALFTNSNSMSVQDIQAFLDSKMPNCDTNGVEQAGGGSSSLTNRQWIEKYYGISPPYRCVRDYRENPDNGQNNYGKTTAPAGALSSAELISKYSKMFSINPQTLIVTLQKENGLITDNIPVPKNYNEAMGFGCPDNQPAGAPACDPAYGSFSTQLYQAARHFRGYMDRPAGWYVPYTVGWNTILWNPNSGCGTSDVYIENKATAALYSYTPYRPNQAALNAQYGYGDGCSAYGNRNFFLYFTDWFGISVAPELAGRYNALGGESGTMGKALSVAICSPTRDSCYQQFQNGYIIYTPQTGAWESKGAIRDYWAKIGFQSGVAGYPTGPESYDSATQTWYQTYQNGIISGKGNLGFWFTNSNINARWSALGGARSGIGSPVAATVGSNAGPSYQQFQNGYIISNPQTGTWESKGTIRGVWANLGFQSGVAGYPTGPESYDPTSNSWYQTYQNGIIAGKDTTGFWFTNSNIYSRWSQLGGPNSGLGMPVESIVGNNTSVSYQGFQRGYIIYSPNFGAWESKGAIRDYWAKIGFQSGVAGYPTGPETYDTNTQTWSQTYQNGTITYNSVSKGSFIKR